MKRRLIQVVSVGAALAVATVHADWANPGTGNWLDGANWDGGSIPWQWAPAVINNGGTAVLDSDGTTVTAREVTVNNGRLIIENGVVAPMWYVAIGEAKGSNGYLEVNGGRIVSGWDNNFTIGAAGNGHAVLNNKGILDSGWLFVGGEVHQKNGVTDGGTGNLVLNHESKVIGSEGIVLAGGPTSTGTVIMNDSSRMEAGILYVGYSGAGDMTINGGEAVIGGTTWVSGNAGSSGHLALKGGVLETTRVYRGNGSAASFTFDGGTLRARGNHNAFIGGFDRVQLNSGGGTIDSNGYAVTATSGFRGTGTLTKVGQGSLNLAADSTMGGLDVARGTVSLLAGKSFAIEGGDELIAVRSGAVLEMKGIDGAQTSLVALGSGGRLLLEGNSTLVLDPTRSYLEVSILDLQLDGSKVNIELMNFSGLNDGEALRIFSYWEFAAEYGLGYDANNYFSLVNAAGNSEWASYVFEWQMELGGNSALYLTSGGTPIPEPSVYAAVLGIAAAGVMIVRRRKTAVGRSARD